ncbi:MAG: methyltransferase domain-containing protein [Candidatus Zapsychrus exili]|nr:methyltransferase domain-containing protein [Candidatus Zapsychrus exili]
MDKMRRILTIIIVVAFAVNSAGQGYALRPMASASSVWEKLYGKRSYSDANGKWGVRALIKHLVESRLSKKRKPILILDIGGHKGEASTDLGIKGHRVKVLGIDIGLPRELNKEGDLVLLKGDVAKLKRLKLPNNFNQFFDLTTPHQNSDLLSERFMGVFDIVVISDVLNYVDFKRVLSSAIPLLSRSGYLVILNTPGQDDESKIFSKLFSPKGITQKGQIKRYLTRYHKATLEQINVDNEFDLAGSASAIKYLFLMCNAPQAELLLFKKQIDVSNPKTSSAGNREEGLEVALGSQYPVSLTSIGDNDWIAKSGQVSSAEFVVKEFTSSADNVQKPEVSLFRILHTEAGRELVTHWICKYPNSNGDKNPIKVKRVVEYLSDADHRTANFMTELSGLFPILNTMRQSYDNYYSNLAKSPLTAIKKTLYIKEYIEGPIVADMGCGWNILGREILQNNPKVSRVIGVDIEKQAKARLPEQVEFRQMSEPSVIPIAEGAVNTAILSFTLHHLSVNTLNFLKEVRRILPVNGKVIVLEDGFSNTIQPESTDVLSDMFFRLPSDEDRFSFLWFVDWFIHNFVNRSREPLVPGNYKTLESWKKDFKMAGFRVIEDRHLGFERIGSRNPVNRLLLVLEAIEDQNTQNIQSAKPRHTKQEHGLSSLINSAA